MAIKKRSNSQARNLYCKTLGIKLPSNFDVHHIDLNPSNNDFLNLVAIPKKLHQDYHNCDLMDYPEDYLKINLIPTIPAGGYGSGHFESKRVDDLIIFNELYLELVRWILYRNHLHTGVIPNFYNKSYN